MKLYKKSLFIFHRDLRLDDNTGLLAALEQTDVVIPCFIFDPCQVGTENSYKSENALQFMIESLQDLEKQLKQHHAPLQIFFGDTQAIIKKIILQENINALFCNRDYTPFSLKRDEHIKTICHQFDCAFHQLDDYLLNPPEGVMSGNGTPYMIFTAYFKRARLILVAQPQKFPAQPNFYKRQITGAVKGSTLYKKILSKKNPHLWVHGGRAEAKKTVAKIKKLATYDITHDVPSLPTSNLSAYLKFGVISIREAYYGIKKSLGDYHPLLRQLYWRDFFTYVAYHSPFVFGHAYHEKYDNLWWSTSAQDFKSWCTGKTGFPIIDAGMRQLVTTGFMHNRVRMIVGSFLVKDLHIDWRWGEKFFAQHLVDYDPAVNNGNWQWVASTGCDAQPYFRIFNPWLQQKKFDPHASYIKKWVPELKKLSAKEIHSWPTSSNRSVKYPHPIADHDRESARAKEIYKQVS